VTDLLAYARELEAEDAALAEAVARLDELRSAATGLRGRAEHAMGFLTRLPGAREAASQAVAEAEAELERRLADLRAAEAELERASKEEAVLAARRAVVRTGDLAGGAERKLGRLRAEAEALEEEARALNAELPELDRIAGELATKVDGLPEPEAIGAAAWAIRAEAALFVARSGLEAQRERVVRQANELGASAFGEPLVSASVSLVRERLERLR
jgi:SWI/SNF-related matrix-associated actin-dependent regulator 1 of chromatin subfamily A